MRRFGGDPTAVPSYAVRGLSDNLYCACPAAEEVRFDRTHTFELETGQQRSVRRVIDTGVGCLVANEARMCRGTRLRTSSQWDRR